MNDSQDSQSLTMPTLGGVAVDIIGAAFTQDTPQDVVQQIGLRAATGASQCLFVLADAINHDIAHFDGSLSKWSGLTGMDEKRLSNIAAVGKKMPMAQRSKALNFEQHQALAGISGFQLEFWRDAAQEQNLTPKQLRRSLIAGEVVKEGRQHNPADAGRDTVGPHARRIKALMDGLEGSGQLDNATPAQLLAMHRDLLPVLMSHLKLTKRLMKKQTKQRDQFIEDMKGLE